MPRSQWKPLHQIAFLDLAQASTETKEKEEARVVSRSALVDSQFLGKTVYIHTGKSYLKVLITQHMLRRKFGEFALTRRLANHAKKTKKKKN